MDVPSDQWAKIADLMSEGLLFCDKYFRIVYGNTSAQNLFSRLGKKKILGSPLFSLDPVFFSSFQMADGSPLRIHEEPDPDPLEATGFFLSPVKKGIRSFLCGLKIVRLEEDPFFYAVLVHEEPDIDLTTELPTRRSLDPYYRFVCSSEKRKKGSLLFCDLEHFKRINDSYGHLKGDSVLRETARSLRTFFPYPAVPFRFGGDEFVIVAPDSTEKELAQIINDLNEYLKDKRFKYLRSSERIRLNFGISSLIFGEDLNLALDRADQDFYRKKNPDQ